MIAPCIAGIARLLTGARARWQGCAPEPKQRVYFANHTSNLDFVLLWAALPTALRRITRPVGAQDYWRGGHIREFLAERVFHAVLIERNRGNDSSTDVDFQQQFRSWAADHDRSRRSWESRREGR